jgi:hypothetical protein
MQRFTEGDSKSGLILANGFGGLKYENITPNVKKNLS